MFRLLSVENEMNHLEDTVDQIMKELDTDGNLRISKSNFKLIFFLNKLHKKLFYFRRIH